MIYLRKVNSDNIDNMERSFQENWDVRLSEEEMKLVSEFKAADQILSSLKLLVSSNFRLAKMHKQVNLQKGRSTYQMAFALEQLVSHANLVYQKLEVINGLILNKQKKPIPLKLLQRLYSRIEEAILFNMKFFTTTKKKAGLVLRGLAQTLEKNVVGEEFKIKKIVDTVGGFMRENDYLLQRMEHLIDQKNMLDVLGAYAQDLIREKEEIELKKKANKKARVSFAQFSGIEGVQIQEDESSEQSQEEKTHKNNSSLKNHSNAQSNDDQENSVRNPTKKTLLLEQNDNKDIQETKRSIKTGNKGKRPYFEAAFKSRKIDHSRKKSFALEALGFEYDREHREPLLSIFNAKSSHLLYKNFPPPQQRAQICRIQKVQKTEIRRSSKTIDGKITDVLNSIKPNPHYASQSITVNKDFSKTAASENSQHESSTIKPILTNKDRKRKYVSADFAEQIPYFSLESKDILSQLRISCKNKAPTAIKTFLIGNQYWGKLKTQGKAELIHQQHSKKHKNNPSLVETRQSFRHEDIVLEKIAQKNKSERMKSMPHDIFIDTTGQDQFVHVSSLPCSIKKPRKSNILREIYNENFKESVSGKMFQKGGIITPKEKKQETRTAMATPSTPTTPVLRKSSYFAIKPKVYQIYNTKNRQLFQR